MYLASVAAVLHHPKSVASTSGKRVIRLPKKGLLISNRTRLVINLFLVGQFSVFCVIFPTFKTYIISIASYTNLSTLKEGGPNGCIKPSQMPLRINDELPVTIIKLLKGLQLLGLKWETVVGQCNLGTEHNHFRLEIRHHVTKEVIGLLVPVIQFLGFLGFFVTFAQLIAKINGQRVLGRDLVDLQILNLTGKNI